MNPTAGHLKYDHRDNDRANSDRASGIGQILRDTLTVILAGGQGTRLYPLTKHRAKPAVPFGGIYRIVDFTLSNAVNSGLRRILLLTQYKSLSLDRHLQSGWNILRGELGEFIMQLPPQQRLVRSWYEGTADAIFQNIYSLEEQRPEYTLILSGDHIYLMDYVPMIRSLVENDADLVIAAIEVDREEAQRFGVMSVDETDRVVDFREKPDNPSTIPGRDTSLVSMGVYVFKTATLVHRVLEDAKNPASDHDFGKNVIPAMIKKDRVFAWQLRGRNDHAPYWRDIGTLDSYWEASMDLLSPDPPVDIYDPAWPIRTYQEQRPPSRIGTDVDGNQPVIVDSIFAKGVRIAGAKIERSILSTDVVIESGAEVSESVLMNGVQVGRGARVRRTLIDKSTSIPAGEVIGYDTEADRRRFLVTENGIVVIPRDFVFA